MAIQHLKDRNLDAVMVYATDYSELVSKGENEQLGFKKSTSLLNEGIISICAFANKHGGRVLFGIADDGTVLGQTVSDDILKNISNSIKLNTEPRLFPVVEKITLDGRDCIAVTIEESPIKPHTAFGRPYMRIGTTNQQLDQASYIQLLENRYNGYGFDHLPIDHASLNDIDPDTVRHFLELANENRSLGESLYLPLDNALEKLELMKGGKLTRCCSAKIPANSSTGITK